MIRTTLPYADIQEMHKTMSLTEIADKLGYTIDQIKYRASRDKVTTCRLTTEDVREGLAANKTAKEIAYEHGVKIGAVYYHIRELQGGR